MRGYRFLVALGVLVMAGCSATPADSSGPPPQIPRITPPTTPSRTPVMVDRPTLPDDCELVVPIEAMNAILGQELPGESRIIIGIKEPGIGRTGKIDCYFGVPPKKGLPDAPLVVGLSHYTDELTARTRVVESVEAERSAGAKVSEIDVGKQKGQLVEGKDEQLLIGSLGKTTFVVRVRHGFVPRQNLIKILPPLAQQAMTPPV